MGLQQRESQWTCELMTGCSEMHVEQVNTSCSLSSGPFPVVSVWRYHLQGSDECAERKMTSVPQRSKCGWVSGEISLAFRKVTFILLQKKEKKEKKTEQKKTKNTWKS